jgi:transcriptional regulator with XRE-family HTH domain
MAVSEKKSPEGEPFDEFLVKIGQRMKELRLALGYTSYEQFAYDHQIGRAQYGKYERGTEDLRLSSLHKIVTAFGMTMDQFFDPNFQLDKLKGKLGNS